MMLFRGFALRLFSVVFMALLMPLFNAVNGADIVIDDFSGSSLNSAWKGPNLLFTRGGPNAPQLSLSSNPGQLTVNGSNTQFEQFALLREDRPLAIGETLKVRLSLNGSIQNSGRFLAGLTLATHDTAHELDGMALLYVTDTRVVHAEVPLPFAMGTLGIPSEANSGQYYENKISTGNVYSVGQSIQFFATHIADRSYRLGYSINGGALVELTPPLQLSEAGSEPGAAWGLFFQGANGGQIRFNDVIISTTSPFGTPAAPQAAIHPQVSQHVHVGEQLYMTGKFSTGAITAYNWNFNDGNITTGRTVSHTWSTPGTYNVQLTVVDETGASHQTARQVEVAATPAETGAFPYRAISPLGSRDVFTSSFYDTAGWPGRLNNYQQMGFNTVVLVADRHLFSEFVKVPGYPEAQGISDAEMQTNRDTLQFLLDATEARGMKLYFLFYNIMLPQSFLTAHGVAQHTDSALTRNYMRAAWVKMVADFPDLNYVITVGEDPKAPVAFVRESIIEPTLAMSSPPHFMIRDQQLVPEDQNTLMEGVMDWNSFVKNSDEQWPMEWDVGPRPILFQQGTGAPGVVALSRSAQHLMWADDLLIRDFLHDARSYGMAGFGLQAYVDDVSEWLMGHAFGYYGVDPNRTPEQGLDHFSGLVRTRFGSDAPGELFITTGRLDSGIMRRVRSQAFYRSGYSPEFGLPLYGYIELPTISSFLFKGQQLGGPLAEHPFLWWMPRAGRFARDYLTVREYVGGWHLDAPNGVVTPDQNADEIEGLADQVLGNLATLRNFQPTSDGAGWNKALALMDFEAQSGRHHAARIRAAITWRRWAADQLSTSDARSLISQQLYDARVAYEAARQALAPLYGENPPGSGFRTVNNMDNESTLSAAEGMQEFAKVLVAEQTNILARMQTNNRLLPLFAESQAQNPSSVPTLTPARWIGCGCPAPPAAAWFATDFDLASVPGDVDFIVGAEGTYNLYVNGALVGSGEGYAPPVAFDVTAKLHSGVNRIAVSLEQSTGARGLLVAPRVDGSWVDQRVEAAATGGQWHCQTNYPGATWKDPATNLSAWGTACVIGNNGDSPWNDVLSGSIGQPPFPPADITHVIDEFSGSALDSAWVASEVKWHAPTMASDTSWNVTQNINELTGRRSSLNTGKYNQAFLLRNDQPLRVGDIILSDFRLLDPLGQANGGQRTNSSFGLVVGAMTNAQGEFGAIRFGKNAVEFTIDPRSPRAFIYSLSAGGGTIAGGVQIITIENITYEEMISPGLVLALERQSESQMQAYLCVKGEPLEPFGQSIPVDANQLSGGFGSTIGLMIEWTADFANDQVQGIFDKLRIASLLTTSAQNTWNLY